MPSFKTLLVEPASEDALKLYPKLRLPPLEQRVADTIAVYNSSVSSIMHQIDLYHRLPDHRRSDLVAAMLRLWKKGIIWSNRTRSSKWREFGFYTNAKTLDDVPVAVLLSPRVQAMIRLGMKFPDDDSGE